MLRDRQLDGAKFRRQYPIPKTQYVVDFYCHSAKLIVEVDGEIHAGQVKGDREREQEIAAKGYRVLRFSNDEVFERMEWVLGVIEESLNPSLTDKARLVPTKGEGN